MSSLANLVPLIILFIVVGGGAYIGYQIYLWSNEMTDRGKKHMEKKNMSFTKEGGLKVGVKEMKSEAYEDRTQNVLVNVWNNAKPGGGNTTPRPSGSRTSSSQAKPTTSRTTSAASTSGAGSNLTPTTSRSEKRGTSPVPGGWS